MTRGVLFDVDGTLVDSNYEHVVAWARAFNENGQPGVSSASIHDALGLAGDELMTHLIGAPDDTLADRHDELIADAADRIVATPGAADLVARCREAGLLVVLVTSGNEEDLEWMLPLVGGRNAVDEVVTSDDVDASKPDPQPFLIGAEKAGLEPTECVIVGDSVWDMKSAKRAGIPAIALGSGGTSTDELTAAGAAEEYADPADLTQHFTRSLLGRAG